MNLHPFVDLHSWIVLCVCDVQWEKQMVRSANFITIQGLTPNKTYYIRVLAFTSVGDGPLSQDLQIIAKTGGKNKPGSGKRMSGFVCVCTCLTGIRCYTENV